MNTAANPTSASLEPHLWLTRFGDELYRFALGRVAEAETAQDLVQETLVSALGALETFRGQASERTWLFVILKRKIVDHYRRQARSPFVPLEVAPDQAPEARYFRPSDGHWRPEQYPAAWTTDDTGRGDLALEQRELQQVLQGCQQRLAPQHLAVFVLRFVEELPAEDICRELSLTSANYWVIVHRAKLQLRRCLELNWFRSSSSRKS